MREQGFSHRWGGSPGLGDSNNILQYRYQATSYSLYTYGDEFVLFWNDLTRAKFISEGLDDSISYLNWSCSGTDRARCYPKNPLSKDYIYIYNRDAYNYYFIGQSSSFNDILPSATLTPLQLSSWDSKADDGYPLSGRIQSLQIGAWYAQPDVASSTGCISATTDYNTSGNLSNTKLCAVSILTKFN